MDRQDFENKLIDWLDRPEAPDDLTSDPEERHALRAWRHTSEQIRARLQQHEPPAALDQKILRAARQQAAQYASPPARSWLHFLQHWQPIATFATLTLVVGMTFLLSQKTLFEQENSAPTLSVRDVAPAAPQTGQRAVHSPMPAPSLPSMANDYQNYIAQGKARSSAPQGSFPTKALKKTRTVSPKVAGTTNPKASDNAVGTRYAPPPPAEEKSQPPSVSPSTPTAQKNTRSVGDFFRRLFSSKRKAKNAPPPAKAEGHYPSATPSQTTAPTTATPSPVLAVAPNKAAVPAKKSDGLANKDDEEHQRSGDADLPSPRVEPPPPQRDPAPESSDTDLSRTRRGRSIRRYRTLAMRKGSRSRRRIRNVREREGYERTKSKATPTQKDTSLFSEPASPRPIARRQRKQRIRPVRRLPRLAVRLPAKSQQPERKRTTKLESVGLFGGNRPSSIPPPAPPSADPTPKKPIAVSRAETLERRKHKLFRPSSPIVRESPPPPRVASNEPSPEPKRAPAPPQQQPLRDSVPRRQDDANTSDNPDKSVLSNKWPTAKKQQLARLYDLLRNNQTTQAIALVQQILPQIPPTQRAELRRVLLDFAQKNRYTAFFQQLSALPQP